jgi:hypothetical protein
MENSEATRHTPAFAEELGTRRRPAFAAPRGPSGRVWPWVAVGLLGLAVVVVRVLVDSRAALRAGEVALAGVVDAEGGGLAPDRAEAIRQFHHAVRMYVPGSPYVARAVEHLRRLAAGARAGSDGADDGAAVAIERQALEALRSGLLGARSLYTPYAADVAAADERLAAIYAALEDPAVAAGATPAERLAFHRERLQRRPGAGPGASLLALLGFGVWVGAAVTFLRRGIDRTLALRRGWALWCGIAFVIGLTLFFAGLRLA